MINELFNDVKNRMNKAIAHYRHEVASIRTGRASTNILDGVKVDYYGTPTPLNNSLIIDVFSSLGYCCSSGYRINDIH